MLEQHEPFKLVLSILNFYGLWQPTSLKKSHKIVAVISFLMFHILSGILVALKFFTDGNVSEFSLTISLTSSFFATSGFIVTFWRSNQKVQDIIDDFDRVFLQQPESMKFLVKQCKRASTIEFWKLRATILWVVLAILGTLLTRKIHHTRWLPEFIIQMSGYFYWRVLYESFTMIYVTTLAVVCQDIFYNLLYTVNAYVSFLKFELKNVDLTESDGKFKLIECVKIHQNARLLVFYLIYEESF